MLQRQYLKLLTALVDLFRKNVDGQVHQLRYRHLATDTRVLYPILDFVMVPMTSSRRSRRRRRRQLQPGHPRRGGRDQ